MRSSFVTALALGVHVSGNPIVSRNNARATHKSVPVEWRQVKCSYGSLTNANNDPTQQFIDAQAAQAYAEMSDAYKGNKSTIPFSDWAGNYFNARPNLSCGSLDNPNCDVTVNCGQAGTANAAVNSPAGYIIINSMVSLHQHYEAQYKGMLNALNFMNGEIGTFSSTFATQFDALKQEKIMIDVTMMLFAVVSGGMFNSWLKSLAFFKLNPNYLGVLKDTTNGFVAQGVNIVKDSSTAVNVLKVQNTLSSFMSQTVQSWINSTNQMTHHVFEQAPTTLYQNILNGKLFDIGGSTDALDVTATMQRTLYGYMVPMAWKYATDVGPFIATQEGVKGTKGNCKSFDPYATFKKDYTIDKAMLPTVHYCDSEGNAYWLVNLQINEQTKCVQPTNGEVPCAAPKILAVPGLGTLDGSKWGGLKVEELTSGAVRAWKANGKKNGWASADPTTTAGLNDIYEHGIQASGMIDIPVCSFKKAIANGVPGRSGGPDISAPNWPCN